MTTDFQVFLEHLELVAHHLHRRLQQALMNGSGPMLLKVRTKDKSLIAKLIVVRACSTQKCHGRVFWERKKLKID
jgi:hypothetical protein